MVPHAVAQSVAATKPLSGKSNPTRAPSRTTSEEVQVKGTRRSIGGGLIKDQTQAKSVSTISSAYIQTQAPVQNAFQYIALVPGADVGVEKYWSVKPPEED